MSKELTFSRLCEINAAINKLPYTSAVDPLWQPINLDADGGTCSNFAVGKFREFVAQNWPVEVLRIACCWVTDERNPETDYHAVLWVDFENRTWELSNGLDVRLVKLSPWHYDRIQNAHTRLWEFP
jgi:predicted transglutaminase-like cysteine proteinase